MERGRVDKDIREELSVEDWEGYPCNECPKDLLHCEYRKCMKYRAWFRKWWRAITGALRRG